MFERYLSNGAPSAQTASVVPVMPGSFELPSGFDPQCDHAHLHRQGVRRPSCDGSF
jgi:hypothetical protein